MILSSDRSRFRDGFTLVELLVVLGVVGLVAALVIPAVQAAREAARKAQCLNNLRQIGTSLQAYTAATRAFPGGPIGFSPHAMLLPYMDQRPLYNALNFVGASSLSPQNRTVASASLEGFLCPADGRSRAFRAGTSYAGNGGVGFNPYGPLWNGAFSLERPVRPQDVRDGSSFTAAMAEWQLGADHGVRDAGRSTFQTATARPILNADELDVFAEACRGLDPRVAALNWPVKGYSWIIPGFSASMYNHILDINEKSCTNRSLVVHGAWTAGSSHPGGAHVLFVDGHARFVKDSLSRACWRALGTTSGGELIQDLL